MEEEAVLDYIDENDLDREELVWEWFEILERGEEDLS